MTAVAVWDHLPTPDALLTRRVDAGWAPTATALADGPAILGHAACRFPPR